jgi:hypothetical protein
MTLGRSRRPPRSSWRACVGIRDDGMKTGGRGDEGRPRNDACGASPRRDHGERRSGCVLVIAETRAMATWINFSTWESDATEPGVALGR